ncbi:MAG TPA: sialate O-acetylesterase [Candidatus Alistipes intestinipullorum]|nr:sialate O-acetylesterase [Candidatus Alistipes intestinipullorum]
MKKILCIIAFLSCALPGTAQRSMWLIAGQSNASGMGDRRSSMKYATPECFDYVLTGDSLRMLKDPVGEDGTYFSKANSGSIAPAFAWHLNRLTGDSVVIVSAARGGSACSTEGETIYGTWARRGVLPLFEAAIEKCRKAEQRTGLRFSGIVWLQGERDANAINDGKMTGEDYEKALRDLIARFRHELGAETPVYIVLTGQYINHPQPGYMAVRAAQRRVAEQVPGVRLAAVDPWFFPEMDRMTDEIHYSQSAYNLIGAILARQVAEERLN